VLRVEDVRATNIPGAISSQQDYVP
jgi:hypothetical protein